MTRWALVVSLMLSATNSSAQVSAHSPSFFALSVPNLEASTKWYQEKLGMVATVLPQSGEARVALLRGPGLVVELVEHPKAVNIDAVAPGAHGPHLVHGFFKAGFFVHDLDALIGTLKKRGVEFKGSVFTDDVLKARSILIVDNSGNLLQLFEGLK